MSDESDAPITLPDQLAAKKLAAPGDLAGLVGAISLATRWIASKVKRARIEDVLGAVGDVNLHGEEQQKLDVLSDEMLLRCLRARRDVAIYASEERDAPVRLRSHADGGRFAVLVDPLDGSSNVDVAVSVGTIFSVLACDDDRDTEGAVLQPGTRQLAAGYVLYGSSVVMMLTTGDGVDLFVLDPTLGEFLLAEHGLRIPDAKKIYSINEAYFPSFPDPIRRYLEWAHGAGYGSRYIGSMVADVHRTLLKGGVFLYPATEKAPEGKLRLLYECNPMSMLVEQAGGAAETGQGRILEIAPEKLHQRAPVVLGSSAEVEHVVRHFA